MKIVITGGAGFLGIGLARALLARRTLYIDGKDREIHEIELFDSAKLAKRPKGLDAWVKRVPGDVTDLERLKRLINRDDIIVFHLASVVSAGGERDFDSAVRVNLLGTYNVLESLRARMGRRRPRLVFASSVAVYGGAAPKEVGDHSRETPATTYGATKAIGELLVNDYARKGFVDGRTARLPTVIIRPGLANAAASGFASAVFREPLAGRDYTLPVTPAARIMVLGARNAIEGMIRLVEVDGEAIGADRAVSFPNHAYSVAEMLDALDAVAGEKGLKAGAVDAKPEPRVEAIVGSWPLAMDATRAQALGLPVDEGLEQIVRDYLEDHLSEH